LNTFDFVILAVLAIGAFAGFRKGLITGIARFLGKIAAVVVAVLFHDEFLSIIDSALNVKVKVTPAINGFLSGVIAAKIDQNMPGSGDDLLEPVLSNATTLLTDYLLKISSLIILFLAAGFIINLFISLFIKPLAKSLSLVNRGGGLIFGFLSSLIVVCLVVGLITPFLTATPWGVSNLAYSATYPFVSQGYDLIRALVSSFADGTLTNPLENLPFNWFTPI